MITRKPIKHLITPESSSSVQNKIVPYNLQAKDTSLYYSDIEEVAKKTASYAIETLLPYCENQIFEFTKKKIKPNNSPSNFHIIAQELVCELFNDDQIAIESKISEEIDRLAEDFSIKNVLEFEFSSKNSPLSNSEKSKLSISKKITHQIFHETATSLIKEGLNAKCQQIVLGEIKEIHEHPKRSCCSVS